MTSRLILASHLVHLFHLFRLRDSTLRAVALSCRRSRHFYQPVLWQNVTLDLKNLFPVYQALKRDEGYASSIRFLHFRYTEVINMEDTHLINCQIISASSLNSKDVDAELLNGMLEILKVVYEKLVYLQSLVIMNGAFIPPSFKQLSCFSTMLKKLFIPLLNHSPSHSGLGVPLNARNFSTLR